MIFDQSPDRRKSSRHQAQLRRTMQNNSGGADTPPEEKLHGISTMGSVTLDAPRVTSSRPKTPIHYRLVADEWIEIVQRLNYAECKVFFYLRAIDPFGDRELDLGVREIARTLKLNAATVSRALKKLDSEKLIDLELTQVRVRLHTFNRKKDEALSSDNVLFTDNTDDLYTTPMICTQHSGSTRNTCPPKPAPSTDPEPSHTDQTIQTLSLPPTPTPERAIEDEELTKYVMNRVKSDHSIKRPRAYAKRVIQNDRAYWEEEFLRHKNAPHEQRDATVPAARFAANDLTQQRCDTLTAALVRGEADKVARILNANPDWGLEVRDGAVRVSDL